MTDTISTPFAAAFTELADRLNGAAFVSLDYTSKGTGERAIHLIQIATDTARIYRDDVATLTEMMPNLSGLALEAAQEIFTSLSVSLTPDENGNLRIGDNPAYTKGDYYKPIVPGVWFNQQTGEVYVKGSVVSKRVIVPGTYNTVKSRPKTLAKKEIEKSLKKSKIREYCLSQVNGASIAGHKIQPTDF